MGRAQKFKMSSSLEEKKEEVTPKQSPSLLPPNAETSTLPLQHIYSFKVYHSSTKCSGGPVVKTSQQCLLANTRDLEFMPTLS
jgi:hypothetical protein